MSKVKDKGQDKARARTAKSRKTVTEPVVEESIKPEESEVEPHGSLDDPEVPNIAEGTARVQEAQQQKLSDQVVLAAPQSIRVISQDRFKQQINALRESTTIKNDDDDDVSFEGETKEEFIRFYEEGYQIIDKMMTSIYETGHFLFEVRHVLKPKKLFLTWMNLTGLQERNSYRYLKIYQRYGEQLSDFAHLGIRKLLAAAKLKNCVDYLEEHVEDAEKQTVQQFEETIRKLKGTRRKDGRGRKPSYEEVGGYKLRRTGHGTKITIEGLSKQNQEELFAAIKDLLLREKART